MTSAHEFFLQSAAAGLREQGIDNEGHQVELDPQDGWQHRDGSVSHGDGTTVSDHPVRRTAREFFDSPHLTVEQVEESYRQACERKRHRLAFVRSVVGADFFRAVPGEGILAQAGAEVKNGIMIAFFPPHNIADELAQHGTEPAEQLHITLAYLGKTADYRPDQLAALPKLVGGWAVQQKPTTVRIGGVGKFFNAEQHVLWASADIPGGTHLHSGLEKFLGTHGYKTPSEHGWNPHLTLSYVRNSFRFMPSVPEVSWTADRVFVCIGGVHTPVLLGGS